MDVNIRRYPARHRRQPGAALAHQPGHRRCRDIPTAVPFSDDHNHTSVHAPGATSQRAIRPGPRQPRFHAALRHKAAGRPAAVRTAWCRRDPARPAGGQERPVAQCPDQRHRGAAHGLFTARCGRQDPDPGCHRVAPRSPLWASSPTSSRMAPRIAVDGTMYMYWRSFPLGHLSVRMREGREQEALAFIDRTWRAFAPSMRHSAAFPGRRLRQAVPVRRTPGHAVRRLRRHRHLHRLPGPVRSGRLHRRAAAPGRSASARCLAPASRDVVWLLLWQFSIPVLIANAIAWPVAWYYLHDWLQGFAYRIPLSPLYFLGAGAVALADRLGDGLRPCPARGPRQPHPCAAL